MSDPTAGGPAAGSPTVADRELALAQRLYDELTGRHTATRESENAVLASVAVNMVAPSERDTAIRLLIADADALGLEVHYKPGCRWSLAQRLAKIAADELAPAPATTPVAEPGGCHPNCHQHGKSPCVGVGCDGMDDEERAARLGSPPA